MAIFRRLWLRSYELFDASRREIRSNGLKAFLERLFLYLKGRRRYRRKSLPYTHWIETVERLTFQLPDSDTSPVLVSLIILVPAQGLQAASAFLDKVLEQHHKNFEVLLGCPQSLSKKFHAKLETLAQNDQRIRLYDMTAGTLAAHLKNELLASVTGEFVTFLEPDMLLSPFALSELVKAHLAAPDDAVFYSDHDHINDNEQRHSPLFKPDWSPELLISTNYFAPLFFIKTAMLRQMGGVPLDSDEINALCFKLAEASFQIGHLAKILCHLSDSTPFQRKQPKPAQVQAHLQTRLRFPFTLTFEQSRYPHVRWEHPEAPLVSIIMPTVGAPPFMQACLKSIFEKTDYPHFELILVNNGAQTPDEIPYFKTLKDKNNVKILHWEGIKFNYSAVNNVGVRAAQGTVLLFLNNDTLIQEANWLSELVQWMCLPEVGAVGAKLLYPDGTLQHAGVIVGMEGLAGHNFYGMANPSDSLYGSSNWYRDYSAVTGACLLIRRNIFEAVGGFDETFILNWSDVQLCLKCIEAGYRIVYNPFCTLLHFESKTHKRNIPLRDFETALNAFQAYIEKGDPYFNPNLSIWHNVPSLRAADAPDVIKHMHAEIAKLSKNSAEAHD